MENNAKVCPSCGTNYQELPDKCEYCKYPFSGSDTEKSMFVAHKIMNAGRIDKTQSSLKRSRIILFVVAAVYLMFGLLSFPDMLELIANLFLGFIFLIFAIIIKKAPLVSVIVPLTLVIGFNILSFLIHPALIFSGLLWKVLIIGSLSYSLYGIILSEKIKGESKYLASKDYK